MLRDAEMVKNNAYSPANSSLFGQLIRQLWGEKVRLVKRGTRNQRQNFYLNLKKKVPDNGVVESCMSLSTVTFHGKTYTNGFPFSNGIPFTSRLEAVRKQFASVRTTWVIRSKKICIRSNGLITRSVETSNRSNGFVTRSVKTLIRSNDFVTRLVKTLIRSNDLITRLVKTLIRSNDFVTRSVKLSIRSDDLRDNKHRLAGAFRMTTFSRSKNVTSVNGATRKL